MAARRVSKTAVNWAAFAERVPARQKEAYRAVKAKSDGFLNRVNMYPENLPAIDWSLYRNKITIPGLVDKFEKAYAAIDVPYPQDKDNVAAQVAEEEKQATAEVAQFTAEVESSIKDARDLVAALEKLPKPDAMTQEMYLDYFPDHALDPVNKPTMWPHTPDLQPQNDKDLIK